VAVFTQVSDDEARELLRRLQLGELRELRGIHGGIENTNYFATTDQGEYVLTLFERLSPAQLPFYLRLMKHLATHGIPVPEPHAVPGQKQEKATGTHGRIVGRRGRPAGRGKMPA
jgi:homoserine kinase type II